MWLGCWIIYKVFVDNLGGLYTIDPCSMSNKVFKTIIINNKNLEIIQGYSTDFKIDILYQDHMESCKEAHLSELELRIKGFYS